MTAVQLQEVHKTYGPLRALDGLSFSLPAGAICGLVGPNGSGKTTTMGLLGGLLRAQSGSVNILDRGPFSADTHGGLVSLMPQDSTPSEHQSLRSILAFYAELQGVPAGKVREEVAQRLAQVQLSDRGGSRYGQLSHGMRRRFSIAQALLGAPKLILLDEPTSGLDPELVVQIRDLIAAQRTRATLLVSSHVLSELETLCDYVVFIDGGRCVREGSLKEVTSEAHVVRYRLSAVPPFGDAERTQVELALQGCTVTWKAPELTVHAPRSQSVEETNRICLPALLQCGLGVLEVRAGDSLEQTYLRTRNAPPQFDPGTAPKP